MRYTVRQVPSTTREPFAPYEYEIFGAGRLVARYWHDFRGDDHWIEFLDGRRDEWPAGRITDFLSGGGPEPLGLTDAAIAYLDRRAAER